MTRSAQGWTRWLPTLYAVGGTLLLVGGLVVAVPPGEHAGTSATPHGDSAAPLRTEGSQAAAAAASVAALAPSVMLERSQGIPTAGVAESAEEPTRRAESVRSVEEQRQLTNEDELPTVVYKADPSRLEEPDSLGDADKDVEPRVHDDADPRLVNEAEPRVRQLSHDEQRRLNDTP